VPSFAFARVGAHDQFISCTFKVQGFLNDKGQKTYASPDVSPWKHFSNVWGLCSLLAVRRPIIPEDEPFRGLHWNPALFNSLFQIITQRRSSLWAEDDDYDSQRKVSYHGLESDNRGS